MQINNPQVLQKDTSIITTAMNNKASLTNNLIDLIPTGIQTVMEIGDRIKKNNDEADAKRYAINAKRLQEMALDPSTHGTPELKNLMDEQNRYEMYGQFGNNVDLFQLWKIAGESARQGNPLTTEEINRVFDQQKGLDGLKTTKSLDAVYAHANASEDTKAKIAADIGLTAAQASLKQYAPELQFNVDARISETQQQLQAAQSPTQRQGIETTLAQLKQAKNDYANAAKLQQQYDQKVEEADMFAQDNDPNNYLKSYFSKDEAYKLFGPTLDAAEQRTLMQMVQQGKDPRYISWVLANKNAIDYTPHDQAIYNGVREGIGQQLKAAEEAGNTNSPDYQKMKQAYDASADDKPEILMNYLLALDKQKQLAADSDSAMAKQGAAINSATNGAYTPVQTKQLDAAKIASKTSSNTIGTAYLFTKADGAIEGPADANTKIFNERHPAINTAMQNAISNNIKDKFKVGATDIVTVKQQAFANASKFMAMDMLGQGAAFNKVEPLMQKIDNVKAMIDTGNDAVMARAIQTMRKDFQWGGSDADLIARFKLMREGAAHTLIGEAVKSGKVDFDATIRGLNSGDTTYYAPSVYGGFKKEDIPKDIPKKIDFNYDISGYGARDTVLGTDTNTIKEALETLSGTTKASPEAIKQAREAISGVTGVPKIDVGIDGNRKINVPGVGTTTVNNFLKVSGTTKAGILHFNDLVAGRNIDAATALADPTVISDPALKAKYEGALDVLIKSSGLAKADFTAILDARKQAMDEVKLNYDMADSERKYALDRDELALKKTLNVITNGKPAQDALKTLNATASEFETRSKVIQDLVDKSRADILAFEQAKWGVKDKPANDPDRIEYDKLIKNRDGLTDLLVTVKSQLKMATNQISDVMGLPAVGYERSQEAAKAATPQADKESTDYLAKKYNYK